MYRTYKKLNFYSTFKTGVSKSEFLDLIKNEKHRQAIAKLPSSNHKLRIETGRYHLPKIPENLRICHMYVSFACRIKQRMKFIFYSNEIC